jgi:ubiquinone biosynthesis protein
VPIRDAPEGPERAEAAEQLIESYYRQVLSEGFFHADPHPGNLMWWDGVIYLLDLGMVGHIGPDMRERLVLLLMALWQEDVEFLADVIFSLADKTIDDQSDIRAFKGELDELVATYRHVKLEDLQLGAILQRMAEISVRYGVPLPASLTLTAKALAQMQFAAAALDPTIDPFEVASRLLMRNLFDQIRAKADHRNLYYQAHKLRARTTGILEAVERLIGAKPGPRPAIEFRAERLERTVRRASRYVALGLPASAAVLGTAIVGASDSVAAWLPWTFGALAAGLTLTLIVELLRKHP